MDKKRSAYENYWDWSMLKIPREYECFSDDSEDDSMDDDEQVQGKDGIAVNPPKKDGLDDQVVEKKKKKKKKKPIEDNEPYYKLVVDEHGNPMLDYGSKLDSSRIPTFHPDPACCIPIEFEPDPDDVYFSDEDDGGFYVMPLSSPPS